MAASRARVAALAAVTLGLAACSGPLGGEGVLTAAGWTPDGGVVAVTAVGDHPDRLWLGAAGKKFRPLAFEYCQPRSIPSVFPLSGGRWAWRSSATRATGRRECGWSRWSRRAAGWSNWPP